MKSALLTTAIVASLSFTQASIHQTPTLLAGLEDSDAYYYIQGLRGLWIGYEKGFYKSSHGVSD